MRSEAVAARFRAVLLFVLVAALLALPGSALADDGGKDKNPPGKSGNGNGNGKGNGGSDGSGNGNGAGNEKDKGEGGGRDGSKPGNGKSDEDRREKTKDDRESLGPAGAKVHDSLAHLAAAALQSDPATPLRVIAFGGSAADAEDSGDALVHRQLASSDAVSVTVAAEDLADLAAQPDVKYLVPDLPVLPTGGFGDRPSRAVAAQLSSIYPHLDGAVAAWSRGLTGRGVGIAVIDSGVSSEAPFGSRLVSVPLNGAPRGDTYGHGTFVATIAAGSPLGRHAGLAPEARVYGVNVSRPGGVYTSDVMAGLEWVLRNARRLNIRVVTLALSEAAPSSYRASALDTQVERLWRAGIVVVASAGNLGAGSSVFAPANDPHIITVGALDANETLDARDDVVASFSSRGTTLDGFAKPDLLAPGRHIVSAMPTGSTLYGEAPAGNVVAPGWVRMSGTSYAAPQVAAAAAILLQQRPRLTPDQVKWLLVHASRPVDGSPVGAVDLSRVVTYGAVPREANQGIVPATFGLPGAPTEAFAREAEATADLTWDPAAWNAFTWNAFTWNAFTWNAFTWNAFTWNAFTWNAFTWN